MALGVWIANALGWNEALLVISAFGQIVDVSVADPRKDMVRGLRLGGDNCIFQRAMPGVPAGWIGEAAVAIKYRLDRARAPCRVALAEDLVKVANQQSLDAVRHALFSVASAQT